MLDLRTLKQLPPPLVDVFYYDGPMDFLSLEGEQLLYLAMREVDREKHSVSWFIGAITEPQARMVLSGMSTKAKFIQKFCTHKVDWAGDENFKVSACTPEDYAPDFLCDPTYSYRWDKGAVDKALYDVRHGGTPDT